MAFTLTRNVKLRLSDNLTADARYNLERLDLLGSTFLVDTSNTLLIRSSSDIVIEPESADIGGSGTGGTLSIGTVDHPLDTFSIHADTIALAGDFTLSDVATGGTKSLFLKYKSDIDGPVDTTADRSLFLDLNGADRSLVLGGNFSLLGANLSLTLSSDLALTLPGGYGTSGQVLSTNGSGSLSWVDAAGGGDVNGATVTWLAADGLTKTVTHSLGSADLDISIFDNDNNELITVGSITVIDTNSILITSSEAPANSWRVVVQAN